MHVIIKNENLLLPLVDRIVDVGILTLLGAVTSDLSKRL